MDNINNKDKYNLSYFVSYISEIINPIKVDIENNKVKNIYNTNDTNPIKEKTIKKIQNLLDDDNFIKITININNLLNIYNEILKHNSLFDDKNKIDIDKLKLSNGQILFDFCSTIGLFLFIDNKDENIRDVIIPKSLLTKNYIIYINLIFDGIILAKILTLVQDKNVQDILIGKINTIRDFLLKFFEHFNQSHETNEIKFANLINFIVNLVILFFVIIQLMALNVPANILFNQAFNMFTLLLVQLPNDKCYFKNDILLFEPNICINKNKSKNNYIQNNSPNYTYILSSVLCISCLIIILLVFKINKIRIKEYFEN